MSLIGMILGQVNSLYIKIILLLLVGALVLAGLLLIVFGFVSAPNRETELAFSATGKRNKDNLKVGEKKKSSFFDSWAIKLAPYIPINVYTKNKLEEELKLIGSSMTPEQHIATAIINAAIVFLGGVLVSFITIWTIPVFFVAAIFVYRYNYKTINSKLKNRTEEIERCLPRFTSSLSNTLKKDRDVIGFLKRFKKTAPKVFEIELDILIADMQSGNQKAALLRSIERVGSPLYSDVMRGIISVIDGNDSEEFWRTLNERLAETQKQVLVDKAEKIPRKLKRITPLFLVGFALQYVVVLGYYLVEQMSQLS